jgi:hypothetical protein
VVVLRGGDTVVVEKKDSERVGGGLSEYNERGGGFPLECAVWKVVEVVLLVSCGGKEALVVVRGRGVVWERRQGRVWTGLAASQRTAI